MIEREQAAKLYEVYLSLKVQNADAGFVSVVLSANAIQKVSRNSCNAWSYTSFALK